MFCFVFLSMCSYNVYVDPWLSNQVLYLLCDLQKSLNYDGLPEMLTSYCYMESLPARTDVFVYNLWLLDNKAYHVSEIWTITCMLI